MPPGTKKKGVPHCSAGVTTNIIFYKNKNTLQLWDRRFCRNSSLLCKLCVTNRACYWVCILTKDIGRRLPLDTIYIVLSIVTFIYHSFGCIVGHPSCQAKLEVELSNSTSSSGTVLYFYALRLFDVVFVIGLSLLIGDTRKGARISVLTVLVVVRGFLRFKNQVTNIYSFGSEF